MRGVAIISIQSPRAMLTGAGALWNLIHSISNPDISSRLAGKRHNRITVYIMDAPLPHPESASVLDPE
jgi:hypothetical protein